jgi:hypothetical protein
MHQVPAVSYPSGHATAAMSLALAAVLISPRAHRPLVAALGGVFALAVSFSIMVLRWHFPSDVVGGYLVATAWALAALAALRYAQARWPERGTMRRAARGAMAAPRLRTLGWALAAIVAAGAVLVASRLHEVASFAHRYTALVAVAGGIAVCAVLLLAGVAVLSSRRG